MALVHRMTSERTARQPETLLWQLGAEVSDVHFTSLHFISHQPGSISGVGFLHLASQYRGYTMDFVLDSGKLEAYV